MILNEKKLKSKVSYAELYQLGHFTGSLMKRDLSEFQKYGITQTTLNELKAQVDNFAMLEPDESFEQDQMLATQERNKISEQLKTAIRDVMTSVDVAFSNTDIVYISSRNSNLSRITHNEIALRGRVLVNLLQKKYEVLQDFGITQEVIDNLSSLTNQLNDSVTGKEISICEREVATNNRFQKANELYSTIAKYNRIGRRMWAERNEALSNDYIISSSKSVSSEKPEGTAPPYEEKEEGENV